MPEIEDLDADEVLIDARLRSASTQLQSQMASLQTPVPSTNSRPIWLGALAGAAAVLLVVAGILVLLPRDNTELDVSTPVVEPETTKEPEPAVDGEQNGPTTLVPTTTTPPLDGEQILAISGFMDDAPAENLVWGPSQTEPENVAAGLALGESVHDPSYNLPVRRMTDAGKMRFDRTDTSTRQAENSDGTLLLTYRNFEWAIVETETLKTVGLLDASLEGEPQWNPTDPDSIRYFRGNDGANDLQLFELRLSTGQERVVVDLNPAFSSAITSTSSLRANGGSPSADGTIWAGVAYDVAGTALGVVSYNIESGELLGSTTSFGDAGEPQLTIVSPSGERVVVAHENGIYVYDINLGNSRKLSSDANSSDVVRLADGTDGFVFADFADDSDTAGFVVGINLETFETVRLFDLYDEAITSVQVSGRGLDKPGWVVLSTYNCRTPGAWTCDKVMAVEIADGGRVLNLAHTYNCAEGFWEEPSAVVNRSFTRVYFNSDGGECGGQAQVFAISVPPFE